MNNINNHLYPIDSNACNISLYENVEPNIGSFLNLKRSTCNIWGQAFWHKQLEILYFTEGDGIFMCDGTEYQVFPGDVFIINSNDLHYLCNCKHTVNYVIFIDPEFFKIADPNIEIEHMSFEAVIRNDKLIQEYIIDAFEEFYSCKEKRNMAIVGKVYALMAHIFRNYKKNSILQIEYKRKNTKRQTIQKIIKYISENYNKKLTTVLLAEKFHISEQYLCRIFKKETLHTVHEYINNLRIKNALPLIRNTDEPISQIARRVGFDDTNYFSKVFKKYINMTPNEYRKM